MYQDTSCSKRGLYLGLAANLAETQYILKGGCFSEAPRGTRMSSTRFLGPQSKPIYDFERQTLSLSFKAHLVFSTIVLFLVTLRYDQNHPLEGQVFNGKVGFLGGSVVEDLATMVAR